MINITANTNVLGNLSASMDHFQQPKASNPNMARAGYSRQVRNSAPSYAVPTTHTSRLPFIKDLVDLSQTRDVTASDVALYSRATGERQKRFYRDRANAIRALHTVFSEHVNLVTHHCKISLRRASDAAGLTTISENEKQKAASDPFYTAQVSISRASRAFADMVKMGWIVAPKAWQVWDKARSHWSDKYFEVTELFFAAVGITKERVEKQRTARLNYLKSRATDSGMTPESVGLMSVTQMRAEGKLAWRRNSLDRRRSECDRKKSKRSLEGKSRSQQRTAAALNVTKQLGDDIHTIGHEGFMILVNKEIARMRRITGTDAPLH